MSQPKLATALVVPFEQLRMTDVEVVGGKNASLGEMISQLSRHRRARARRLCHHGARLSPVPRPRRPGGQDQRAPGCAEHRRRARAGRSRRADSAVGAGGALAAGARRRGAHGLRCAGRGQSARDVCRAFVGHRRRPARCVLCRPARDVSERARHRRRAGQDARGLRLAVQRPRHQLPRAQGLRACRRGPVGRRATHGALGSRQRRRGVHDRHRVGLPRCGVRHVELGPGRNGGAGRREPRRVLRPQADAGGGPAGADPALAGLEAAAHDVHDARRKRRRAASS